MSVYKYAYKTWNIFSGRIWKLIFIFYRRWEKYITDWNLFNFWNANLCFYTFFINEVLCWLYINMLLNSDFLHKYLSSRWYSMYMTHFVLYKNFEKKKQKIKEKKNFIRLVKILCPKYIRVCICVISLFTSHRFRL